MCTGRAHSRLWLNCDTQTLYLLATESGAGVNRAAWGRNVFNAITKGGNNACPILLEAAVSDSIANMVQPERDYVGEKETCAISFPKTGV